MAPHDRSGNKFVSKRIFCLIFFGSKSGISDLWELLPGFGNWMPIAIGSRCFRPSELCSQGGVVHISFKVPSPAIGVEIWCPALGSSAWRSSSHMATMRPIPELSIRFAVVSPTIHNHIRPKVGKRQCLGLARYGSSDGIERMKSGPIIAETSCCLVASSWSGCFPRFSIVPNVFSSPVQPRGKDRSLHRRFNSFFITPPAPLPPSLIPAMEEFSRDFHRQTVLDSLDYAYDGA